MKIRLTKRLQIMFSGPLLFRYQCFLCWQIDGGTKHQRRGCIPIFLFPWIWSNRLQRIKVRGFIEGIKSPWKAV